MREQTIDTYRLTSMEEPSDEILAQLMREAAATAREKSAAAHRAYFDNLQREAAIARRKWLAANSEMPTIAQ